MKSRPLLTQVLAVNLLLVAGTAVVATVGVDAHGSGVTRGREAVVLGLAVVATLLGNWLLLRRRFEPLDQLISTMEQIDLAEPEQVEVGAPRVDSAEVQRLDGAFRKMVSRLETERRQAGWAAIEAQERERRRIAQDLHDEVNQALTAVTLRLQASIEQAPPPLQRELAETKRLSSQAMEELLSLARQLRPAVLDDHGLIPALHSQVRDFAEQTGTRARFNSRGTLPKLTPEQQLVIYRVTQESLSNIAQHANAHERRRRAVVRRAHRAADQRRRAGDSSAGATAASDCPGCASARCWPVDNCRSGRKEGQGTRVELTIA